MLMPVVFAMNVSDICCNTATVGSTLVIKFQLNFKIRANRLSEGGKLLNPSSFYFESL